jgi:hypothetical protein
MSENKSNRREFLTKLGLVLGAATVSASGFSEVVKEKSEVHQLTNEQAEFAPVYEKWLKEFHTVTKIQKEDPQNVENNKKMVSLAEEAQLWQKKLHGFMKDENFVKFHKVMTEKITDLI